MTTITTFYKGQITEVARMTSVPDYAIIDMALAILADPSIRKEIVFINDAETGEFWWDSIHAEDAIYYEWSDINGFAERDDEPADIDSDMGFDPYMGCFSDDC